MWAGCKQIARSMQMQWILSCRCCTHSGSYICELATASSWFCSILDLPVLGAPPDTYESFVAFYQHWELQLFWVFNSLSFFFSTATLVIGVAVGIPWQRTYLREEVAELRCSVVEASYLLSAAIAYIIAAFCIAGTLIQPPIQKYKTTMHVCVPLGALFCFILLFQCVWKVWRWSLSSGLTYKWPVARESSTYALVGESPTRTSDLHKSEVDVPEQLGIYGSSTQEQMPNGRNNPSSSSPVTKLSKNILTCLWAHHTTNSEIQPSSTLKWDSTYVF